VEIWEYLCWNHCQENGTARHFVAATNVNDTVPRFLENGVYDPKPSISNAMDVGSSNFIRIQELYQDLEQFKKDFHPLPSLMKRL
jgi:threonine synthase